MTREITAWHRFKMYCLIPKAFIFFLFLPEFQAAFNRLHKRHFSLRGELNYEIKQFAHYMQYKDTAALMMCSKRITELNQEIEDNYWELVELLA